MNIGISEATSESQDQMESRLLLDVVVGEGSAIFELLSSEDESLLIRGNTFLVLDLSLDVLNGVWGLNVESDGLSGKSLNENLHTTSESEDQMKCWLLLNVVVTEGSTVFKLLTSEDKSLLIGRDTFLILDLGLHVLDSVWRFNIEGDGLSSEGFDEDLHTTSESENQVKGWFLLDVVIGEGSAVFELLSSEDESLLIRRDSFLVLDLGLDVFDGVRRLNIEGDGLSG
jgi:hypothetical protein